MSAVTAQQLENASRDADDLGLVVNGDQNTIVQTRLGGQVKSIRNVIGGAEDIVAQVGTVALNADRANNALITIYGLGKYRPTIAAALALTTQPGEAFTSDESGELLAYRRTSSSPFYERAPALDFFDPLCVGLFSDFDTSIITSAVDVIRTSGHTQLGIGSAFYTLVDPDDVEDLPAEGEGVWWHTSLNGRTFQLDEKEPDLFQYGALPGGDISLLWPIADRHVMRTDSTLIYPAARFTGNVILGGLTTSRTRFRATRPVCATDDSKLENGSILQGTLWIKSPHHEVEGFGVDHGSAWFNDIVDVFKVSPYVDGTGPVAGTYTRLKSCVALGATRTGATHAFLGENLNNGIIDDIEGCKYFFAVALKMVRCTVGVVLGRKASTTGRCIIIKRDAQFGGGGINTIGSLIADGSGDGLYGISVLLQGARQMERLSIGSIMASGCKNPVAFEVEAGSTLNDLFINNIIAVASGGNINNAALILNGNIANAKLGKGVLKPSVGSRGFFFANCTAVDMGEVEVIVPEGGLLSQAGYVYNVSSTFFGNVRATQNGDLGIPAFINYDDAGAGKHRVDGLSYFIPYPVNNNTKPPLRPQLVSDAMPSAAWYNTGEFVRKTTLVADGNNMAVMGWSRVTSGDTHVAGTDWRAAYVSLVSPAT